MNQKMQEYLSAYGKDDAQLLVQGHPVAPELLAHHLHRELEEVRSILQAHPELEYDEQGNLVGSGLTLVSTAHQFQVEQRTLFAWCAFDTLAYPVELLKGDIWFYVPCSEWVNA